MVTDYEVLQKDVRLGKTKRANDYEVLPKDTDQAKPRANDYEVLTESGYRFLSLSMASVLS